MSKNEWAEVKSNWFKLENVGDSVEGVLVDTQVRTNTLKQPPVKQKVYTLVQEDGTSINIGGRHGSEMMVLAGLESCKPGQMVRVTYSEDKEPAKAGFNPTKIVKVESNGVMKPEVVTEYKGESFEVIDEADIPPFD